MLEDALLAGPAWCSFSCGFVFAEPAVHQLADDEVQASPSQL